MLEEFALIDNFCIVNSPQRMRPGRWFLAAPVLLLFLVGISAGARERSLLDYSPFQPPDRGQSPVPARNTETRNPITERLEFRGFFEIGGDWSFSIYDKSKRHSHWLSLGQSAREENFAVTDFDRLSQRLLVEWGGDQAYLDLLVAGKDRPLRPRGGSLAGLDTLREPPLQPPAFTPPPTPPPPPVSSPPAGPPPEIPREVLAQYEQMLADEGDRDRVSGAILGGGRRQPGTSASTTITGLPPARRPGTPATGDPGSGDPGAVTRPGTGIEIPGLPTGVPGAPPGGPPNIEIPEIPDFPED